MKRLWFAAFMWLLGAMMFARRLRPLGLYGRASASRC